MPHFSSCCEGADEYICQCCGQIKCSRCKPPVWRPDITKSEHAGNVCPTCISNKETKESARPPISLYEHCRIESGGLTGKQLDNYINRHYGHN